MPEPALPGYQQSSGGLYVPTDLRAASSSDLANPAMWLQDWALGGGLRLGAGVPVNQATALGLAGYYACIRNISEDIAKLPLPILREVDGRREKLRGHRLWGPLNREANVEMTAFVARRTMQGHVLAWGNAYALILRDRTMRPGEEGQPIGYYPLHPANVRARRDESTGALLYDVRQAGIGLETIPAQNMLHLQGLSQDGIHGLSILQIAAQSMGLSIAAQEYGATFFGNATSPGGILKSPTKLSSDSRDHLVESMEKYRGSANAGKFLLLEGGIEYSQLTIPPEQAQFLATRTFQLRDIARWFRMPLTKLADLEHAHYSNMEQENTAYATDTLGGWLTLWEQEIQRKLLGDDPSVYVRHNVNALMRGDSAARAAYYRTMVSNGIFSPNVVLEFEDMDGYAGGDEHFLQLNMATVADIVSGDARESGRSADATDVMDHRDEPTPMPETRAQRNGHAAGAGKGH